MSEQIEIINAEHAAQLYGCVRTRIYQLVHDGHLDNVADKGMRMVLVDANQVRRLRDKMSSKPKPTLSLPSFDPGTFASVREVALYLGHSSAYIYQLFDTGEFTKHHDENGRIVISADEVIALKERKARKRERIKRRKELA